MFNPFRKLFSPSEGGMHKQQSQTQPLTKEAKRRLWVTVGLTVALLFIWFGGIALGEEWQEPMIAYVLMIVYFTAFAAVLIAYLIYNRAFVNKNVTVDMLPMDWSEERKTAFVEDNRRRAEKSRWMVTLIIPFATVFLVDSIYLFLWDSMIAPLLGG